MYISAILEQKGETRLFLLPKADDVDQTKYILVEEEDDDNKPLLELLLDQNKFTICEKDASVLEEDGALYDKLSILAIKVIEAVQQGRDLTEKGTLIGENPYDPDKIRVETKNFSLRQIYDMISDGDVNLSPDFQRNLVWDSFRKSRLIESILLRIPLPLFYFSQDDNGVLSVVDGLQRLTAIKEFMDNKLTLKSLEYLHMCDGKKYSGEQKIDDKYIRWFNMTQIIVNIVDPQSPHKVKYDIFRRINTGGKPLNAQELRNCLSSDHLRNTLKQMSTSESFIKATGNSISDLRMDAQEFALRFIYFKVLYDNNNLDSYTGSIDSELDELVETVNKYDITELQKYVTLYETAMSNAYYLFGKHAFRKVNEKSDESTNRSQINKALFVSWSVLLSDLDMSQIQQFDEHYLVKILGETIDKDGTLYYFLSYGTNGKRNILYSFKKANEIIRSYLCIS